MIVLEGNAPRIDVDAMLAVAEQHLDGTEPDYGGYVVFKEDGTTEVHHSYYWLMRRTAWWRYKWRVEE